MNNTILRDLGNGWVNCFETWGWYITSFKLSPPEKRKTLATVPYRSGSLDFSELYGIQAYEDREMEIVFKREAERTDADDAAEFVGWLYTGGRRPLSINNGLWIYDAECVAADTGDETDRFFRTVTARFQADPFRRFCKKMSELHEQSGLREDYPPLVYQCDTSFSLDGGISYARIRNTAPAAIPAAATATGGFRMWMDVPESWVGETMLTMDYAYDLAAGTYTIPIKPGDYYIAVQGYSGLLTMDWTQIAL